MDIKEYIASGIIEQYVLGLCNEEDAKELEQLCSVYPELHEAILKYELELEERMMKEVKMPTAETDEKILRNLGALQAPVISLAEKKPATIINWYKPLAAASVILLAVFSFFLFSQNKKINKLEQQIVEAGKPAESLPAADYEIMKNPAITPVAMYGVGIHSICRCTMFWDKKTGKMYIMIHHLPQSSDAKDYQLWAMVDGKPVSIGIINDEIRGRFIEMKNVPAGANAFSVTLEKAGGSSSPDSDVYLQGRI